MLAADGLSFAEIERTSRVEGEEGRRRTDSVMPRPDVLAPSRTSFSWALGVEASMVEGD